MTGPIIIVTNEANAARLAKVVRAAQRDANLTVLTGRQDVVEILEEKLAPETLLVGFSTGVIVPAHILSRLEGPAYNFHAASPEYPGRDIHHFAVYYGARRYGATAHEMEPQVDFGRIVGVEWFDVAPRTTPQALRRAATQPNGEAPHSQHVIEHGDLLGDLHRVVPGQHDHHRAEVDPLRLPGEVAELL